MPENNRDQTMKDEILNDIFKKVNKVSSTVETLLSIQKKESKQQSETVAMQEEQQQENSLLFENEKQYRIKTTKLLEEIRDKEFFAESEGGIGNLLGIIGPLLTGLLPTILASLATAATAGVFYKLGNWIYENSIAPWFEKMLDERAAAAREQLNASRMKAIQAETEKGEKLYTEAATGRTITEKEATQIAESQGKSLKEIEETGAISPKITTVNAATGEAMVAGQKTTYSSEEITAMNEPTAITERQKLATPETQEDVQKSKVNNQIRQLDSWKQQLEQIGSRFDKEYSRQEDADQDFNNMSGIIRQLVNYRQTIGKDPNSMEYRVFAAYLKDNPLIAALSTETRGSAMGITQGMFEDPYFHPEYDTWSGKGLKLKMENARGLDYDINGLKVVGKNFGIPIDWIKAKENRSLDEYVMISQGKEPKMRNEGIVEGSRSGSRIIIGENYTSEAVVSTKPNNVTESIGNNLYKIIKQSALDDITSTQRQSAIIGNALNNTTQQYNDAYKIAPLSQGGQTIVNNFMGGMVGSRISESNPQFNISGLVANNTETVLQKVYMDTYKAALL